MLEQFIADLEALRQDPAATPSGSALVLAWKRSNAGSLLGAFDGRMSNFTYYAGVYPVPSVKGTKPSVVFVVRGEDVDDLLDVPLDAEVRGWPTLGRAALIILRDRIVWPVGPGDSVVRPKRLP